MAERTVVVRLKAVTSSYTAAMAQAGQATSRVTQGIAKGTGEAARGLQSVQTEATIAGGALLGIGVAAVAASTTFDKQMSAVQAATKGTAADLEKLRASALKAGADTAFSATEAAQGQEQLAKAGVSTADILGGGLTGALSLAAAGEVSVGDAAETAATALTVFGLKGSQVEHVADLLAAGAGKAQGGVSDLSMAMKQSALVAQQTGLSVEDTVGALSEFASAGLLGSDAGTSFKTMLQRLTPQSEEAADLMDKLGLNAYDASGQFIGLEAYAGKLRSSLSKLTPEQRNSALATLFGSDAVRAAAVLYNDGAEGVKKWRDAVNDSGYASDQAAKRLDNLAGDLEQLRGSLETTFIKTGSQANGVLRTLTQLATNAVNIVGGLPGPVLAAGLAVTTASGAFLLFAPRIVAASEAMDLLATKSPRATKAVLAVGKAAGVTAAAITTLSIASDKIREDFTHNTVKGSDDAAKALLQVNDAAGLTVENITALGGSGADLGDLLHGVFDRSLIENINGAVLQFSSLGGVLPWGDEDNVKQAQRFFESVDSGLVQLVTTGRADEAAKKFQLIADAARAQGISVYRLQEVLPGYTSAVDEASKAAQAQAHAATVAAAANGDLAAATQLADEAAADAKKQLDALKDALDRLRGGSQTADEATANLEAAFDDAAEKAADLTGAVTKDKSALNLHTKAGRDALDALTGITDALFDAVPAWKANGDSAKSVRDRVLDARIEFIKQAVQMGLSKQAAKELADRYKLIPGEVVTEYKTPGSDAAKKAADDAAAAIAAIPRLVPVRIVVTKSGSFTTGQGQSTRPGTAGGGFVYGEGTSLSDSILQPVSDGEFVTRAAVAQANRPLVTAVNDNRLADAAAYLAARGFGGGGGGATFVSQVTAAASAESAAAAVTRAHRRMAFEYGFGG